MSNARRYRRSMGQHTRPNHYGHTQPAPEGQLHGCPWCATPIELLQDWQDWYDSVTAHGMKVGPLPPLPAGAEIAAWWVCHNCGEGGAVYGIAPPQRTTAAHPTT